MTARPTIRTAGLTAAYAALSVADTVLAGRTGAGARRLRVLTKLALMPLLNAALRDAHPAPGVRRALTAAQAFSWGGDVALLGAGKRSFLAGLGSFAGAHATYLAVFATRHGRWREVDRRGLRATALLWLGTAPVLVLAARRRDPALAGPVAAYATLLAATVAAATTLDRDLPAPARRATQTGAVLFLVSDTVLGVREFLLGGNHPARDAALDAVVMGSYTAAQGLIAVGTAHL